MTGYTEEDFNPDEAPPLYKDCVQILLCFGDAMYFYAPKNDLDNELFKELVSSDILKHDNIGVYNNINKKLMCEGEQYLIGEILTESDNWVTQIKCNKCNLIIPVDMDFYSKMSNDKLNDNDNDDDNNNDKYSLCKLCYNGEENLNLVNINSGIGNYNDWVFLFTITRNYEQCGSLYDYYLYFYCNLNKNSIYYKKFAMNHYVSGIGEEFEILEQETLEEVIKRYWKEKIQISGK